MTGVMPRLTTTSAPNGHEQGECVVHPLIIICFDILGGVTPSYSVAIALPLFDASVLRHGLKREEVLLLIECYRKRPCLWNSTLNITSVKIALNNTKTLKFVLENNSIDS